jgi:hypothetical protein
MLLLPGARIRSFHISSFSWHVHQARHAHIMDVTKHLLTNVLPVLLPQLPATLRALASQTKAPPVSSKIN